MAGLSDDLIVEIIARLPLKYAKQCSLLNKNLRRRISHPSFARRAAAGSSHLTIFHCSRRNPIIFTRFRKEISSTTPAPGVSVTLAREISIMASCNGLLLLHSGIQTYVFNPVTSGIMLVNRHIHHSSSHVGLAVDLGAENSHCKLVTVDVEKCSNQKILRFGVVAPTVISSGRASMFLKSRVDFVCHRSFNLMADVNIWPVYAHGSMYWLGDCGRTTAAFDVERERATMSDGPVQGNEVCRVDKWFGFADGSVQFVYALREEIVVCGHDHVKGEWRVKQRIDEFRNGKPLYFDGGRLFLLRRKRKRYGEVLVYYVLRGEWEMSWVFGGWADWQQLFFSYFPTTAEVSDTYLNTNTNPNTLFGEKADFRDALLGLRQLLNPTNSIYHFIAPNTFLAALQMQVSLWY